MGWGGEGEGQASTAGKDGGDPAVTVEGGVQAAVRVIARQGKIRIGKTGSCIPRHYQLAIGLDEEGEDLIRVAGEVGGDPAAAAKGGVQAAVRVIARQGKVILSKSAGKRPPRHHQLAVGLDSEGEGLGRAA